jgi:hypothetical protein
MDNLCPFFKERCHGNECIMWKNEECLLVAFLRRIQESVPVSEEKSIGRSGMILHREETEVPKWLRTSTPEELAEEMLEFGKKEFPEEATLGYRSAFRHFWESKGIHEFLMPSETQMKIEKANYLVERQVAKERKSRLAEEKEELPSLVSQCLDWARINDLKRLTLADVDTFIMEKELDILSETKRAVYSSANVKLKSRK